MNKHLTASLLLGSFAAFASGCSNSGGGAALPSMPSAQRASPASLPKFRGHVRIREFSDLPTYSTYYTPASVAAGPDGKLWVIDTIDQDFGANAVVAIATSGKRRNTFYYPGLSSEGAGFQDIAAGADGALWITDQYNQQIVRMTTKGSFTNFAMPGFVSPFAITAGPDHALWFTAQTSSGNAIGRITTAGRIKLYANPAQASDIAAGPDGALWFTEDEVDRIARITTRGRITEYSQGITPGSRPLSITPGPDGALWFTESAGGRIGRITTSGSVTEYSRGITPSEQPYDLAAGPDGAIWFTESKQYASFAQVGRISMSGRINQYSKGLDRESEPTSIVAGPDNRMWFVESAADKMGRLTI